MKSPQSSTVTSSISNLVSFFPLDSADSIVELFRHIVRQSPRTTPDLTFVSIVFGFFESKLHAKHLRALHQQTKEAEETHRNSKDGKKSKQREKNEEEANEEDAPDLEFPVLTFKEADCLYQQFVQLVTEQLQGLNSETLASVPSDIGPNTCRSVKLNNNSDVSNAKVTVEAKKTASRELIKSISDLLWKQLYRNYQKEKTHIQFLYSFLTDSKLDSFGVAYGVVAVSQLLGYSDVTLALSEDHAWVVFGPAGSKTAELTWHGRGQEEKRGLGVDEVPDVPRSSWLYLNGHPVLCDSPLMAAAAAVTSINPDSCGSQLVSLKRRLLWLLHLEAETSPLENYPLALLNLADLETMSPSAPLTPLVCGDKEAEVRSAYLLRPKPEHLYLRAIEVNRRSYANQHVYPYTYTAGYYHRVGRRAEALKYWADAAQVMSNFNYFREDEEIYKEFREIATEMLPQLLLKEPSLRNDLSALANILRFYDGICQWEEGSVTPVLHTGWADRFMSTLFKFEAATRRELILLDGDEDLPLPAREPPEVSEPAPVSVPVPVEKTPDPPKPAPETKHTPDERSPPPVTLEQLKAECGKQLFNPAYLLGLVSSPAFLSADHPNPMLELVPLSIRPPSPHQPPASRRPQKARPLQPQPQPQQQQQQQQPPSHVTQTATKVAAPASPASLTPPHSEPCSSTSNASLSPDLPPAPASAPSTCLHLRSEKMRGLKALLTGPRLNASAIKLQLTAQSQIDLRRTDLDSAYPLPRKRARRG